MADPKAETLRIPWCLQGAFIFSLIGAHCVGAVLHKHVNRAWRLEVAMTGCLALDLSFFCSQIANRI